MLRDLITRTNVYITARGNKALNVQLLENVARWTGSMLRMFGLGGSTEELGWGVDGDDAAGGSAINVRF